MGKTLIIKGADFSKYRVDDTINKPERDIVLTNTVVESNKLLNTSLQVGDTLAYQPNNVATYTVWGVSVEYTDATYRLVTNTQFGTGGNTVNDNYCVFAVVLDNEDIVLDVILANSKDSTAITNDTYEIDMSKYDSPAKLYFNNNKTVTATALSS